MQIPHQLVLAIAFLSFFAQVHSYEFKALAKGQTEARFAGQFDFILRVLETSAANRKFSPPGKVGKDGTERETGAVMKFLGKLRSQVGLAKQEAGQAVPTGAKYIGEAARMDKPLTPIEVKSSTGDERDNERKPLFFQARELLTIMSKPGENLQVVKNQQKPANVKLLQITHALLNVIESQLGVFDTKKQQREDGVERTYTKGPRRQGVDREKALRERRALARRALLARRMGLAMERRELSGMGAMRRSANLNAY